MIHCGTNLKQIYSEVSLVLFNGTYCQENVLRTVADAMTVSSPAMHGEQLNYIHSHMHMVCSRGYTLPAEGLQFSSQHFQFKNVKNTSVKVADKIRTQ